VQPLRQLKDWLTLIVSALDWRFVSFCRRPNVDGRQSLDDNVTSGAEKNQKKTASQRKGEDFPNGNLRGCKTRTKSSPTPSFPISYDPLFMAFSFP